MKWAAAATRLVSGLVLVLPLYASPEALHSLVPWPGLSTSMLVAGLAAVLALLVYARRPGPAYAALSLVMGYLVAQGASSETVVLFVAVMLASSAIYSLSVRVEAAGLGSARHITLCDTSCIAVNAASAAAMYGLLAVLAYYGSVWSLALYRYALAAPSSLRGPVAVLWKLLAHSPTVWLVTAIGILVSYYYVFSRILVPLIHAFTASPEQLRREVEEAEKREAEAVLARRKWYHRMLGASLLLTGFLTDSFIALMVLALAAAMASPLVLGSAARYLLWLASLMLGYLVAKHMPRLIGAPRSTWVKVLAASLILLGLLVAYSAATDPDGLVKTARVLASPFTGAAPPVFSKDPGLGLSLASYEGYIYRAGRFIEHVARLMVEILWG